MLKHILLSAISLLALFHLCVASSCPAVTILQSTDAQATTRCNNYPNGLTTASSSDCCTVCAATSNCNFWVYEVTEKNCFPCVVATGRTNNTDRVLGIMPPPPPPPPPPASWQSRIAANDMLYTPNDGIVPSSLMPMVGNGFLATQVGSGSVWVSAIFNGYLTSTPSHRARVPATNAVPPPGYTTGAALDLREAIYYRRSYIDPSEPGTCTAASMITCSNAPARIWVEQRWYAHRALPSVMVMEVQILDTYDDDDDGDEKEEYPSNLASDAHAPPSAPASSFSSSSLDSPPYAMLLLLNNDGGASSDLNLTAVQVSPDAPYRIMNGSTLISETNSSGLQGIAILTTSFPANNGPVAVPASAPLSTLYFLTVVRTTIETASNNLIAAVEADYAVALSYAENGTLASTHIAEWAATIWPSGFETDRGDLARAANASLYAILSSVRNDREYGLSPGGLTDGYHGHVFWDCESWMFPGVSALLPDVGNALLQYRVARLSGAMEKATTYTPPFSGAMFPWESGLTGVETCPSWAATGLREIHISGDIAVAVWSFWRASQDNSGGWLNSTAYPLLSGIADFWMSKIAIDNPSYDPSSSSPLSLLNVIPPDEYADHVNNSAYTNAVAILSLQRAAAVAQLLGEPPSTYSAWLSVAARISIPYSSTVPNDPSAVGGYHPEYDGYKNGTQIKQADTILLGFPLEVPFGNTTPASRANDLNYYATVTDAGGPAMTWGMFAVGYIELGAGYEALAASNFNRSFANMQPPFLVWTETPSGGTNNFITGAGGFLSSSVLFGYTGLRVNDTAMTLSSPNLPEGTTTMTLRSFAYLGNRMDISLSSVTGSISITVQVPPASEDVDAMAKRRRWGNVAQPASLEAKYPVARGLDAAAADPSADSSSSATLRVASRDSYASPCFNKGHHEEQQRQCIEYLQERIGRSGANNATTPPPSSLIIQNAQRPLSTRSQFGRVVLGGGSHIVLPQQLILIDSEGVSHRLLPGIPMDLPIQSIAIVSSAAHYSSTTSTASA